MRVGQDRAVRQAASGWSAPSDGFDDSALIQDTLSLLDAAMDQCDVDGEAGARAIIDRLAVDLLACIRERSMQRSATPLRVIPAAARP